MNDQAIIFIATADLAGQVRGRAVPASALESVLRSGTGWVPADLAIGAFGELAHDNPFGSVGDLRLLPDVQTGVEVPPDGDWPGVRIFLADQTETDGSAWACCPRTFLRAALEELEAETGLHVVASFEHEFMLVGLVDSQPFSFARLRGAEPFGSDLVALLERTGLEPENWLPEYGDEQFEITLRPAPAQVAADRAVLLKELVRDLAVRRGLRASFAPLLDPDGSGNGVHIHVSLRDGAGAPVLYDADGPGRLSSLGRRFAAGVLAHASAITAWTAPSPTSFLRLTPHRWSAGGAYLAERDREALLRICPTSELSETAAALQLNLEFRAADATANPWLALGAIVRAGLEGIRAGDEAHVWPEGTDESDLSSVPALPGSLEEALQALEADHVVAGWFDPTLLATHLAVKRLELAQVAELDQAERILRVASVY